MNKLIEVANEFIGANAETKFQLMDYYNKHCFELVKKSRRYRIKYNDDWCAMFVSVVAHKCGFDKGQFPFEVSVREQVNIAKANHTYYAGAHHVDVGDLLIFDWLGNGGFDHVGFVSDVSDDRLGTIEGNKSGTVGVRSIRRHSRAVRGVIKVNGRFIDDDTARIMELARGVLRGDYGDGFERMERLGKDYGRVQRLVNELSE